MPSLPYWDRVSFSLFFFFVDFILFYVHECFVCMYLHHLCVYPTEVRRRHHIPWDWSYGYLSAACRSWEPNLGSLLQQQVLLTTEPSSQPHGSVFLDVSDMQLQISSQASWLFSASHLTWGDCRGFKRKPPQSAFVHSRINSGVRLGRFTGPQDCFIFPCLFSETNFFPQKLWFFYWKGYLKAQIWALARLLLCW